jgi:hypothetical protein
MQEMNRAFRDERRQYEQMHKEKEDENQEVLQ